MPLNNEELNHFITSFWLAGSTAAVAKSISAPLDRIKLILQNQHSVLQVISGERKPYNGILDCLIRLPKEQGVLSFWRGNGINLIRYFPTQALNFSFNDLFKRRLGNLIDEDKGFLAKFLAGSLAGTCAIAIVYPLESCQTKISADVGTDKRFKHLRSVYLKREFRNLSHCFERVSKIEGIVGLYKGFLVSLVGTAAYRAFYFGLYDAFKSNTQQNVSKSPFYLSLLIAQGTTIISGTITYPLDTVSRRLMIESGRPKKLRLFTNARSASRYMYLYEGGFKAFYGGLGANCLRGFSGAFVLAFYDQISSIIHKL